MAGSSIVVVASSTGWWIGLSVGFAVVVVAVGVVGAIITFATRLSDRAAAFGATSERTGVRASDLRGLARAERALGEVTAALERARRRLGA